MSVISLSISLYFVSTQLVTSLLIDMVDLLLVTNFSQHP